MGFSVGPLNTFRTHVVDRPDLQRRPIQNPSEKVSIVGGGVGGRYDQAQVAHLVVSSNMHGIALDLVRDAKVDNLERSSDQDEVCRFEVGMDDLPIMHDLDALEHLQTEPRGLYGSGRGREMEMREEEERAEEEGVNELGARSSR